MSAHLTVVGSGTLFPSADRASACHLVEAGGFSLLLDAGPGAVHGLARLGKPWWELAQVVFTHYHTDHFGDLPHLLFALKWAPPSPRVRPLRVCGPPGLLRRADALRRAHGEFIGSPGFPLDYREVARDAAIDAADGAAALRFAPTRHTAESVAVRVELAGGGAVGYTGDTGPDPALGDFMRGVGVLVCECAHADSSERGPHLSPESVAEIALRAQPRVLVLTHLYPHVDPAAAVEAIRAAGYRGRVSCASDGDRFAIPGSAPRRP